MIDVLSKCEDFLAEKPSLQKLIEQHGHHFLLLPKFHCELNPIERCWAFSKKYIRERSINTISSLRTLVNESLSALTKETVQKYFRKVREYERAYREGAVNTDIDKYVKTYKSHRIIRE